MLPDAKLVGNMALLPLKTQFKGPARGDGKNDLFLFTHNAEYYIYTHGGMLCSDGNGFFLYCTN